MTTQSMKTSLSEEMEAKLAAYVNTNVVTITAAEAEEQNLGSFTQDAENNDIVNYLHSLGAAARFTGAIIGQRYRYKGMREVREFDAKKPEYLIDFTDDNLKVNGWFMRTFMKRTFIGKHEDAGGLAFNDYILAESKVPVEYIVIDAIPRTFQGSENASTSQRAWDFQKLAVALGKDGPRHCKTFRSMQSKETTQEMKSEAYDALGQLNPISYLKDLHLTADKSALTPLAIKSFVICDLVIQPIKFMDINTKQD